MIYASQKPISCHSGPWSWARGECFLIKPQQHVTSHWSHLEFGSAQPGILVMLPPSYSLLVALFLTHSRDSRKCVEWMKIQNIFGGYVAHHLHHPHHPHVSEESETLRANIRKKKSFWYKLIWKLIKGYLHEFMYVSKANMKNIRVYSMKLQACLLQKLGML